MKFQVTNTINDSVETFNTMNGVNEHIASEIKWFNSLSENENNNGYDESDFIIEEQYFVICDKTDNSGKPYISDDGSNTGDICSARKYDTEIKALKVVKNNKWN